LLATVKPGGSLAEMGEGVALQFLMQQLPDEVSQLLDRQRETVPLFSPRRFSSVRNQVAINVSV